MTSVESSLNAVEALAAIRTEASERLTHDLQDVRAALTTGYDQAIARLDESKWVPLEPVSRLVNELSATVSAERQRATTLEAAIKAAEQGAQRARAESQAAVDAAREQAARDRDQALRELNEARESARTAAAAEAHLRDELGSVRKRFQDILEAQMLQLVRFQREIEQATTKADRPGSAVQAPAKAGGPTKPETAVVPINLRVERRRSAEAPAFEAIEAVLADSPPLGRWPSAPAT